MEDKFILFRRDGKGLPYGRDDVWIKELIRTDGETALAPIDDAAIEKINEDFYKALVDLSKKLDRKEFQSKEWHSCIKEALHEYPEVADVFSMQQRKLMPVYMSKYVSK